HKLQFGDWWSGAAFWYPLHPLFETTADSIRAEAADATTTFFFLSLGAYALLAWQLGFPAFAWRRGVAWRGPPVGGALGGWAGSVFLFREPLFGAVYLVACLCYLTPAEWRALADWFGRLVRMPAPARLATSTPDKRVKAAART